MRDEVVEVLIKSKNNGKMIALKISMIILCILAVLSAITLFGSIAFIVAVIAGGIAFWANGRTKIEYEYTYFQKELQVDIIYNQENRKPVATYDLSKMEACVKVKSDKMGEYERRQLVTKDYSSKKNENESQVYAIIYDGSTKILFEPNEKLLKSINYDFPRKVFEY